jgi:Ca2+-binding RTX toxin-like protein
LCGAYTGGSIDLLAGSDSLTLGDFTNTLTASNTETITGGSGDDTITLGTTQSSGVIDLMGGTDTLNLAAGSNTLTVSNTETINATALNAGHVLTLSGSGTTAATLDGGDLAAGAYTGDLTVTAGAGGSSITTGSGADIITGGTGGDTLTGGGGNDAFVFTNLTDSLASGFDTITDFVSGTDQFSIGHALAGFAVVAPLANSGTGTLADDLAAILDSSNLVANGAAEVTISAGVHAGTYAIIGDATAGYNAATDAVVKLSNAATLQVSDFV